MSNIKKLRIYLRMNQTEFAEWLGCSQVTVSKWENGKAPSYIEKLAEKILEDKGDWENV